MIRVGIVGLGMAVTPHAKSLLDLKDRVQVAYAFSPSAERRRKFAERFDFPQCDRLETILEDRSVGAVLVLTPPNTHLEIVERCAAAGKHVLLEKPLEVSTAKAEQLVKKTSHVKLGVVLQHRFARQPKAAGTANELGELVSASAAIPNWRPQSYYDQPGRGTRWRDGGGVLLTQAIHTSIFFFRFSGEPAEVKSFVTTTPVHRMETEDLAVAAVRFKNGAIGTVHATTTAYPGFPERIELIGTRGTALLEGTSLRCRQDDGSLLTMKLNRVGAAPGPTRWRFRTTGTVACWPTSGGDREEPRAPR